MIDLANYAVVNEKEIEGVVYTAYRSVSNPRNEIVVRNNDLSDYKEVHLKADWEGVENKWQLG